MLSLIDLIYDDGEIGSSEGVMSKSYYFPMDQHRKGV